jgi:hypothetical protein
MALNDWIQYTVNDELKRIWKDKTWPNLRYYSGISL